MTSTLSRLSEPSTACLMCSGRLFRPAFPGRLSSPLEVEPELGGDHHLPAEGGEGLAHELFVRERAVDLGGVEERDAAFDGRPEQRGHLLLVLGRAVAKSSCPCSRARGPRLPGCSFRVCASAFVSPSKCHRGAYATLPNVASSLSRSPRFIRGQLPGDGKERSSKRFA